MKILLSSILAFTIISSLGADPKYPVSAIPDELKKDVNVVVREDKMVYTINSISTATSYAYLVVTIFNSQGKDFAYKAVGYDKLSKITKFKANVYDATGTLIKKLKSSEFLDRSSFDGFSLFSDNRYKSADLTQGTYPYTVEFEYEVEYKFLYAIDGTYLIPGERASVEHASYQLNFPSNLTPRYKVLNIQGEPVKSKTVSGLESLTWTFENLKPIKFEPYGPSRRELIPRIIAAPSGFEYEGYAGDMSTWESYGKWEGMLLNGREELPESAKLKVREITSGLSTPEEKVKKLYEYLQSKTRYVSIQLGIGGLQPVSEP